MSDSAESQNPYVLQCMDIWSGNHSVENEVSTPGLDMYVFSQPYRGEGKGGDVHYVSLCAGGVATRLILADVSGHGTAVAGTSQDLRTLMRRFMNSKSQTRLVRELNREFTRLNQFGRFATAVVATYLANGNRITICNAGHPRPLLYRQISGAWSYLSDDLVSTGKAFNLPLGLDESTAYQQLALTLDDGDMLAFYTDALTETRGADDKLLGEEGLLRLVSRLATPGAREFGQGLLQAIRAHSANRAADDDLTILVLRYVAGKRRLPGVREKLNAYAKLLRLKPV